MKSATLSSLVLPWAMCLAICAGVEATLHLVPATRLLTYDQQSIDLTQNADFVNIRRTVISTPPPQICIIGSSRAKAIVSAPTIRQALGARGFDNADVRVYAGPDLNAAACLALLQLMRAHQHVPALIVYAVEPRQLADCQGVSASLLCDLPQGFESNSPVHLSGYKPFKRLVSTWADIRIRSLWLRELVRLQPPRIAQTLGGYSADQTRHMLGKEEDSLVLHPRDVFSVQLELFSTDCEKRFAPSHWQTRWTEQALDLMKVTARSVVVELPMPGEAVHAFPPAHYDTALGAMRPPYYDQVISFYAEACGKRGIPFIRAAEVGFVPEDKYFGNATHANWSGAQLYSKMLTEKIILPALRE